MSRRTPVKFRLYVADDSPNSALAVANLTAFSNAYLPGRHQIELVDVFREPERALADGIFMTPTLLKLAPYPTRKIIGTLSQMGPMIQACRLDPAIE